MSSFVISDKVNQAQSVGLRKRPTPIFAASDPATGCRWFFLVSSNSTATDSSETLVLISSRNDESISLKPR